MPRASLSPTCGPSLSVTCARSAIPPPTSMRGRVVRVFPLPSPLGSGELGRGGRCEIRGNAVTVTTGFVGICRHLLGRTPQDPRTPSPVRGSHGRSLLPARLLHADSAPISTGRRSPRRRRLHMMPNQPPLLDHKSARGRSFSSSQNQKRRPTRHPVQRREEAESHRLGKPSPLRLNLRRCSDVVSDQEGSP